MKKGTSFFYISLALLAITFISCQFKIEEENLYDKPGVNVTNNQVTLIVPKVGNGTKYINVYRRDKKSDDVINIGILYHPTALENDNKNYCYIDTLVKENHSYDYRVRYYIDGNYYYSAWSDQIEIKEGYKAYEEDKNLTYKANGTYLVYEKTDYTLTFNGSLTLPEFPEYLSEKYNPLDDDGNQMLESNGRPIVKQCWQPMLIVQTDKLTQAFEISGVTNTTSIALRSLLPAAFLDTDITIKGIVAQKIIYDDDNKPESKKTKKTVIWTEPITLDLEGAGSSKKINIPSQTGSAGLDYSRKAQ